MRPQPDLSLTDWICSAAQACSHAQQRLDDDLGRVLPQGMQALRKSLTTAGLDLPASRLVITQFELTAHSTGVRSRTLGQRVEAGVRLGKHFAGLAYESRKIQHRSRASRFTVHIVPRAPVPPVQASDGAPA